MADVSGEGRSVMTLQTPRRRISPQTKRRCRAIKGFFRRALGTASQPDLQITSSIAVNVTDNKHKTPEQRFHQTSQYGRNCVDDISEKNTHRGTKKDDPRQCVLQSGVQLNGKETKILYKTPETNYTKSDDSECGNAKNDSNIQLSKEMSNYYDGHFAEKKNKKSNVNRQKLLNIDPYLRKHKTKSAYESFGSAFSGSSFHTLNEFKEMAYPDPGDTAYEERKGIHSKGRREYHKDKVFQEHKKQDYAIHEGIEVNRKHKQKPSSKDLDKKFIADIIRKQYKPVKIGRRISDLSQFSTPQCRDKELRFRIDENIQKPTNANNAHSKVTGCYEKRDYSRLGFINYHSDIESTCESRDYNFKNKSPIKQRRKQARNYNDSDIYDLVPVKEKSSPKSRRKFLEDNIACGSIYKEVPPSPRSHRPRLNLKAQCYTECEEELDDFQNNMRPSPRRLQRHEIDEIEEIDYLSHPNRRSSPKRFMHQKEIENEMNYIQQTRRVLIKRPKLQIGNNDDVDYITRPYSRISPETPIQEHDSYDEIDFVIRPSRSSSPKRSIVPTVNEDNIDYKSRPSRRNSPHKTPQQQYNNDEIVYVTRPGMRTSPERPIRQHLNEDEEDFDGFASRRNPKLVIQQGPKEVVVNDQPEISQNGNRNHPHIANIHQQADISNDMGGCSFQCSTIGPDENIAADKTQETVIPTDKTDKALCEIKDILQSFLQEIKKESTQSDKSDISAKMTDNSTNINPNICCGQPNSVNSLNDYNSIQCPLTPNPFLTNFANNSCCYPIMPICPVNCLQCGFPAHSASFTCTHCANKPNETVQNNRNVTTNDSANGTLKTDTNELIKEIYKFVSQSPTFCRKQGDSNEKLYSPRKNSLEPQLTSRSAGGSTAVYRHNAKVGTPRTNCVSKSCEAITQKVSEEYTSETNQSYSETILEKVSLEATITDSTSDTESSSETEVEKKNKSKFARVLKSFRIFKKKPKDVIQELSESEEEREEKVKKPPFRQNITNYMMHDQEYFIPPLVPPYHRSNYNPQNYGPPYNREFSPEYPMPPSSQNNYHNPRMQPPPPAREPGYPHYPGQGPTAPPLSSSYETYSHMPQVPVCLKEIEVKSIGCQSERKLSFFRKIRKKNQNPAEMARFEQIQKSSCSTQTAQNVQKKPGLFNWSNMQAKAVNPNDPLNFSYKTKRLLEQGDSKMRKAMLKKMFYKKNPFSPNNLIIKTLLGKEKSSYGEPPSIYRPRMFM